MFLSSQSIETPSTIHFLQPFVYSYQLQLIRSRRFACPIHLHLYTATLALFLTVQKTSLWTCWSSWSGLKGPSQPWLCFCLHSLFCFCLFCSCLHLGLEISAPKHLITKRNSWADCRMVSEAKRQSVAWMETDYSKHTHFRWKIKWRLEHLGTLGIMGETALRWAAVPVIHVSSDTNLLFQLSSPTYGHVDVFPTKPSYCSWRIHGYEPQTTWRWYLALLISWRASTNTKPWWSGSWPRWCTFNSLMTDGLWCNRVRKRAA